MFENKKILITGSTGMLGSHLVELLCKQNADLRIVKHIREIPPEIKIDSVEIFNGDLTDKSFARQIMKGVNYVFHLAAYTGGLGRTSIHPATTLTPNLTMDGNVLDAAKEENVEKFLYASCACIYPNSDCNLAEGDAWKGEPPEVHASYSWAKRMGERQAISYHKEFGMPIAIVRPSNSYGPRDNFDPTSSHVISALIIKAKNKMDPFIIWGDGTPIREFIYAEDAAKGMLSAMEKYTNADPINLASGEYASISELAHKIIKICNYNPEIKFDSTKPNGQKRRVLTNEKAYDKIKFKAETSLDEGLKKTIQWYEKNYLNIEKHC